MGTSPLWHVPVLRHTHKCPGAVLVQKKCFDTYFYIFVYFTFQRQGLEKLNMNLIKFGHKVSLGCIKLCVKLLYTQNMKSRHLIVFY